MDWPIHFNHQSSGMTVKVGAKAVNQLLSANMNAEFAPAYCLPQCAFRWCH